MNTRTVIALSGLVALSGFGQGTFQNLDFENAVIPPGIPTGTTLSFANAFPGWIGYFEAVPATSAIYNTMNLGSPGFAILTTNAVVSAPFTPFQGRYTALLQAGSMFSSNASLAQIGTLPSDAASMRFLIAGNPNNLAVTLNGQPIGLTLLQTLPGYYEYGADVSAFAGLNSELRFTQQQGPGFAGNLYLDNISFSPIGVPEPGTWALLGLGGALLWCGAWRRRK